MIYVLSFWCHGDDIILYGSEGVYIVTLHTTLYDKMTDGELDDCAYFHSRHGRNYEWLATLGCGRVVEVWFEEPAGSGKWTVYTDKWWHTHCEAVDHIHNLAENHIRAFVDPETRFARMLFDFEDGTSIIADERFYNLEQEYFELLGLSEM